MEKRYEIDLKLIEHQCESWHEGTWIFFKCTRCDFVRKINCETGDLIVVQTGDAMALHRGVHLPLSSQEITPSAN